jgi:hypothetical protein
MINANFIAMGLSKILSPVDNEHIEKRNGEPLPAIAPTLVLLAGYIRPLLDDLSCLLRDINEVAHTQFAYWDIARCVLNEVSTVPVSLADNKVETSQAGLQLYRPWKISGHNSASNAGAASIFTTIFHALLPLLPSSYGYVRMDVDLYMKWMRVRVQFLAFL